MNRRLATFGVYIALFAAALGGMRGINMAFNNRTVSTAAYTLVSRAKGLSGHIEYIKYADGSQDVKEYPGLGHRTFDSELTQDLDGDGLVDRIRKNGAEWKMNRLSQLLVREHDFDEYAERFMKADAQLEELAARYSH